MEKYIFEAIKPFLADRPDTIIIILTIIGVIYYCRSAIQQNVETLQGWLKRHDKEFEKRDQKFDSLMNTIQEGFKEERSFQQKIHFENEKRIVELIEMVGRLDERTDKRK